MFFQENHVSLGIISAPDYIGSKFEPVIII